MKTWTATSLYEHLQDVKLGGSVCLYTPELCEKMAATINKINAIKKEKNAIILAHSYVVPEIIRTVADFCGDSYELSKRAKESDAELIIFAAVKFMAEGAKLLNPEKRVFVPSLHNGCSLADSITGDDVKALKEQHPDFTFVCYINTTVDVKAECDVCVTSSNVYDIITAIPNENIYFVPDRLMGQNIINELAKRGVKKTIKYWHGTCYVHEEYSTDMIDYIRLQYPGVKVSAHPECSEEIIGKSDFIGSTSQMVNYVKENDAPYHFMLTECGLTSRIQSEEPGKTFVGSCTMCKYMKSNSLDNILSTLENEPSAHEIHLEASKTQAALNCLNEMFRLNNLTKA